MFFDGTGNNRANTAAANRFWHYGSYTNARSNVAKLETLYFQQNEDIRNTQCPGYLKRYRTVYKQGIGTIEGWPDDPLGQGAGVGPTGVENRVFDAAIEVGDIVRQLSPTTEPEEVVLDVFGFSRGAAGARHFVNAFREGRLRYIRDFWFDRYARVPDGRKIRIRFIGLFDTVASIQYRGGGDNHGDLNLNLKPGSAESIMHLTAEHEIRENFPLTDTTGAPTSRELPGVHSDIGGGYGGTGEQPSVYPEREYSAASLSAAQRLRDTELARLNRLKPQLAAPFVAEGYIEASDIPTAIQFEVTDIRPFRLPTPVPGIYITTDYSFKIITRLDRDWVRPHLSRIALHIMHKAAKENGQVPMHDITPGLPGFDFDSSDPTGARFTRIANSMVAGSTPSEADKRFLIRNYGHHSAHYDLKLPIAGYPMRERRRRRRRIIPNRPGSAS